MLDDVTASLVDATLAAGQGVATLSLNVSFLRPAQVGPIHAEALMMRRGREVCHVMGTLRQDGKDVATAVAVCKVV
jgi:acyl-coenzyme A thioesterase PaaI-like protein